MVESDYACHRIRYQTYDGLSTNWCREAFVACAMVGGGMMLSHFTVVIELHEIMK